MTPRPAGAVVTYFPDALFPERLAAICRETAPVIVVDNSADAAVAAALRAACALHGATLHENARNAGLGAALNTAAALLAVAGAERMVAFDQDSTPAPGFAAALLAAAGGEARCLVGANWHEEARDNHPSRHLRPHPVVPLLFTRVAADRDLEGVTCVITSGLMAPLQVLRELGGFDEPLFLDLVDTDLCLRARRAGIPVRVAAGARLAHRRGAKRPARFLGGTWWPAHMPANRLRLLFENRVRLIRRDGLRVPHWAVFEIAHSVKMLAEILCLEDRKAAKLAACARGALAGLRGARRS